MSELAMAKEESRIVEGIAKQAMHDEGEHFSDEESVKSNSGDCMRNYDFMNEFIPSSP